MKLKGILEIVNILNPHSWTSTDHLKQELKVSVRTIRRYINEINEAFHPALDVIGGPEGYRLETTDMLKIIRDDPESYRNFGAVMVSPFGHLVNQPKRYPEEILNVMKDAVQIHSEVNGDDLKNIFHAMRDGYYVEVKYKSIDKVKDHRCVPIRIYLDQSILYLNVYDEEKGYLITLAMTKVVSVGMTRDKLPGDELKTLRGYLASAWGKMIRHDQKLTTEVSFDADNFILPHFEINPMHSSQKIVKKNGKNTITLMVHHPVEFVRWSLRYGENVTILGPKEVLDELNEYLDMLKDKYKK